MGMAASQARLLSLQARQSNLEYQGQQINQERTILSQQCTELYNSLLDMNVPTPPSTQDYTKVEYTGNNGTIPYSFEPNDVKPKKTEYGDYNITFTYSEYTHSMVKNNGYKNTTVATQKYNTVDFGNDSSIKVTSDELKNYCDKYGNTLTTESTGVNKVEGEDGMYTISANLAPIYEQSDIGSVILPASGYTIGGHWAFEVEDIVTDGAELKGYKEAIANFGLKDSNGNPYGIDKFYAYKDEKGNVHFALKSDVQKATEDNNNTTNTYDYTANGEVDKVVNYDHCKITFDPSSGRITSVDIPCDWNDDETKEVPTAWQTIVLTATTVTDNNAYKDAYAQYEYAQLQYDKKQQEVNAKTEVIQQQDRNLELRLQRLDNERTMIKTEIDAVDKVINENIEKSYKTFSG